MSRSRRIVRRLTRLAVVGGVVAAVVSVLRTRIHRGVPADIDTQNSPLSAVSRGSRSATMARLAARRARDRTWTKARQRLADDEQRRHMQAELERREAEDVVAALGHMKGAMMKLGQMASYLDEGSRMTQKSLKSASRVSMLNTPAQITRSPKHNTGTSSS